MKTLYQNMLLEAERFLADSIYGKDNINEIFFELNRKKSHEEILSKDTILPYFQSLTNSIVNETNLYYSTDAGMSSRIYRDDSDNLKLIDKYLNRFRIIIESGSYPEKNELESYLGGELITNRILESLFKGTLLEISKVVLGNNKTTSNETINPPSVIINAVAEESVIDNASDIIDGEFREVSVEENSYDTREVEDVSELTNQVLNNIVLDFTSQIEEAMAVLDTDNTYEMMMNHYRDNAIDFVETINELVSPIFTNEAFKDEFISCIISCVQYYIDLSLKNNLEPHQIKEVPLFDEYNTALVLSSLYRMILNQSDDMIEKLSVQYDKESLLKVRNDVEVTLEKFIELVYKDFDNMNVSADFNRQISANIAYNLLMGVPAVNQEPHVHGPHCNHAQETVVEPKPEVVKGPKVTPQTLFRRLDEQMRDNKELQEDIKKIYEQDAAINANKVVSTLPAMNPVEVAVTEEPKIAPSVTPVNLSKEEEFVFVQDVLKSDVIVSDEKFFFKKFNATIDKKFHKNIAKLEKEIKKLNKKEVFYITEFFDEDNFVVASNSDKIDIIGGIINVLELA